MSALATRARILCCRGASGNPWIGVRVRVRVGVVVRVWISIRIRALGLSIKVRTSAKPSRR